MVVAEEQSFTKAAAKLGVAQSTLSHAVKRLETQMGIRLLARTTRNVAVTEAGERLLQTAGPRMSEIAKEISSLMELKDSPSGSVRITLSDHAMQNAVWPKMVPILKKYPGIKVEFHIDNAFRNIVKEGFDAGIRLGESIEKDMIAVRIGPDWRLVAVASPQYFHSRRKPDNPDELVNHICLNMRHSMESAPYIWEFEKGSQSKRIRVNGQLMFSGSTALLDAIVKGFGIAYVPEDLVEEDISRGTLVQVLDEWSPYFEGYFIYYPSRHQNLPAFKIIIEALRHRGTKRQK